MSDSTPRPTPGRLVVVSGPSGVGKSTVVRNLLASSKLPLQFSVSATTRSPRPGEVDGREYHFLTVDEFHRRRLVGEFLETAEVFGRGDWYGTLVGPTRQSLVAGRWVVLEIDIAGMEQVVKHCPDAVTIFITPGSWEELQRRLVGRGTETPTALDRRLEVARIELAQADRYRYQVLNDDPVVAATRIDTILHSLADGATELPDCPIATDAVSLDGNASIRT